MKKIIAGLIGLIVAGSCFAAQLSYTTAEVDQFLTRADHLGWAVYFDSVHTNTATGIVINNTRTNISCNGLGSQTVTTYLPNGVTSLWDTNANEIVSSALGNAYNVRVQFKAEATVGATFFDIEFDIGDGAGPVIAARTLGAPKASGIEIQYSIGIPLFSMQTFVNNGCGIWIDTTVDGPGGSDITIYDIQVMVQQVFYD